MIIVKILLFNHLQTFQSYTDFISNYWYVINSVIVISIVLNSGGIQGQEISAASKHFMAFGGGMRFCVGTEFTKVQMAVFLHCLVTKYR